MKAKKLLAILLTLTMVLSFSVAAFADVTITITQNATAGTVGAESYDAYKIFDVKKTAEQEDYVTEEPGPGEEEGFSYTIAADNDTWLPVLWDVANGEATEGQEWVTLTLSADGLTYAVEWTGDNTADAADAFAKFLLANKGDIVPDYTLESSEDGIATETVGDGYYMITSSLGTNLIAATTNINMVTKNEYPTTEKAVAKTNYNVGDDVEYTITVNIPATVDFTKPVIVHDTMDDVLSFNNDVTAKSGADADAAAAEDADAYTEFTVAADLADGCTFEITMDISDFAPDDGDAPEAVTVVFTFTAELLMTAEADTGYVNDEFVEYSEYTTPESEVDIKTFDIDINKIFTGDEDNEELVATFELYGSTADGKDETPIVLVEETQYESYVRPDSTSEAENTIISVRQGTTANIRGLAAGTYYLSEVATEDGYNKLATDVTITIDADGNVSWSVETNSGDDEINVTNNSGAVLPSTGGIGTTLFYVVGGMLVAAALVMLITKKRMSREA